MGWYYGFKPYVSVAQRRQQALREMEKRRKQGHAVSPIVIDGRTIASTFWGKAWCDNLESYSDFANRLPRGRTYVRNGSVVHLEIKPGQDHGPRQRVRALQGRDHDLSPVRRPLEVRQGSMRRPDRLTRRAPPGTALEERHGRRDPAQRRPLPEAGRDRDEVLLSRLGRHVQACRRGDVRHRRAARPEARAAVPAPQGRSPGADRGGR